MDDDEYVGDAFVPIVAPPSLLRAVRYGLRALRHVRFSEIALPTIDEFAMRMLATSPPVYEIVTQALLEQLSVPWLDTTLLGSTDSEGAGAVSGWGANTRFFSIPLYDRQSATVFKQAPDAGLVRAIVLSPQRDYLFAGSATTSSSEIALPTTVNVAAAAAGGPEPCLRVWNTRTWVCEQSILCGEDIAALVMQEV